MKMRLVEYMKEVINCLGCFHLGNGVNTPKIVFVELPFFPDDSVRVVDDRRGRKQPVGLDLRDGAEPLRDD
jgi:hypothetical protein